MGRANDARGLPQIVPDPESGTLPPPFVDDDADGLADVNDRGHWVLSPETDVADIAPYGQTSHHAKDGRALTKRGAPLYEYVDFRAHPSG